MTEMVTGLDLVALQIAVALGEHARPRPRAARRTPSSAGSTPRTRAGTSCRARAGSRATGSRAARSCGWTPASRQGREVPGDYDSMFAKLIVSGEDREQARRRMLRALDEYVVEGVPTTIPVHRWVLESQEFRAGDPHDDLARAGARRGGLPRRSSSTAPAAAKPAGPPTSSSRSTGAACRSGSSTSGATVAPERPGAARRPPRRARPRRDLAPMQGTILKVLVEKGQEIRAGEVVCILEAMKMENHIASTPRRRGDGTADPRGPGRRDRSDPRRHRLSRVGAAAVVWPASIPAARSGRNRRELRAAVGRSSRARRAPRSPRPSCRQM